MGHLIDVSRPVVFGLRGRNDLGMIVLAHIAQAIGHPLDVLLDTARDIAEGGPVVRADNREQVGKTGTLQAEIGPRPVGPLVLERPAAHPANIDLIKRPGDRIEARGIHDDIALILSVAGLDARGGNTFDRGLVQVNQNHVVPIIRLVVAAL